MLYACVDTYLHLFVLRLWVSHYLLYSHCFLIKDGQVTAVITAATACTAFLLTVGMIMVVLLRMNKRYIQNTWVHTEHVGTYRTRGYIQNT